jgi:hypothetical protein
MKSNEPGYHHHTSTRSAPVANRPNFSLCVRQRERSHTQHAVLLVYLEVRRKEDRRVGRRRVLWSSQRVDCDYSRLRAHAGLSHARVRGHSNGPWEWSVPCSRSARPRGWRHLYRYIAAGGETRQNAHAHAHADQPPRSHVQGVRTSSQNGGAGDSPPVPKTRPATRYTCTCKPPSASNQGHDQRVVCWERAYLLFVRYRHSTLVRILSVASPGRRVSRLGESGSSL